MKSLTPTELRVLRNEIPIDRVIARLAIPAKPDLDGYLRFRCPLCAEFHTATHPRTNLARCFRCQVNFNTIDLVIAERNVSFLQATRFLLAIREGPQIT